MKRFVDPMSMINVEGQPCDEKPIAGSGHWICQHLRQFLDSDALDEPVAVRRILVGANKSTEIFVLADRPPGFDPQSLANLPSSLLLEGSRVNCEACWTTPIFDER